MTKDEWLKVLNLQMNECWENYFVWICVTHFVFYCNTQSRKINSEWIMMKASYYNLVLRAYDNNNDVSKKTFVY